MLKEKYSFIFPYHSYSNAHSPLTVDEQLFCPTKTVSYHAVGDVHSIDILVIYGHNKCQRISNFDIFSYLSLNRFSKVNFHRSSWHGRSGSQWIAIEISVCVKKNIVTLKPFKILIKQSKTSISLCQEILFLHGYLKPL